MIPPMHATYAWAGTGREGNLKESHSPGIRVVLGLAASEKPDCVTDLGKGTKEAVLGRYKARFVTKNEDARPTGSGERAAVE